MGTWHAEEDAEQSSREGGQTWERGRGGDGRGGVMGMAKGEGENVMINVGPTAGMVHTR